MLEMVKDSSLSHDRSKHLLTKLTSSFSFHFSAVCDLITNKDNIVSRIQSMVLPDQLDESGSLEQFVFSPIISDSKELQFFQTFFSLCQHSPSPSFTKHEFSRMALSQPLCSESLKMIWLGLTTNFESQLQTVAKFAYTIPNFHRLCVSDRKILLRMATVEVLVLLRTYFILSDVEALVSYSPVKDEVYLLPFKLMQSNLLGEEFYAFHDRWFAHFQCYLHTTSSLHFCSTQLDSYSYYYCYCY